MAKQAVKSLTTIRAKLAEWQLRYGEQDYDDLINDADQTIQQLLSNVSGQGNSD